MGNQTSSAANISNNHHHHNNDQTNEPEDTTACRVCAASETPTPPSSSSSSSSSTSSSVAASSMSISSDSPPSSSSCPPCYAYSHSVCPLNRAELGRASWAYLHTLAAYYPTNPTSSQQHTMSQFIRTFSTLYPCNYCADRTNEEIIRNPPRVESQQAFSEWLCEVHNEVNDRLNKPRFDCQTVLKRWKTGEGQSECN